jgi:hypothetical protein
MTSCDVPHIDVFKVEASNYPNHPLYYPLRYDRRNFGLQAALQRMYATCIALMLRRLPTSVFGVNNQQCIKTGLAIINKIDHWIGQISGSHNV